MSERETGSIDPLLNSVEARIKQIRHALNHAAVELHLKLAEIELNPDGLGDNARVEYEKIGKGLLDIADLSELIAASMAKDTATEFIAKEPNVLIDALELDSDKFSFAALEAFRKQINKKTLNDFFEDPLEVDEVYGLIDLYGRKSRQRGPDVNPEVRERRLQGLLLRLQGMKTDRIAEQLGVDVQRVWNDHDHIVATLVAELNTLLDTPKEAITVGTFSAQHVEIFRQQINEYAQKELFSGPLDYDEVMGIIDAYAQNFKPSNKVDLQIERLLGLLEGKRPIDIEKQTSASVEKIQQMKANAAKLVARHFETLFFSESDFSTQNVEALRKRINKYAKDELLSSSLSDDEVYGLIDIYARHAKQTKILGQQVDRLLGSLKGKTRNELDVNPGTMHRLKESSARIIANNLNNLFAGAVVNNSNRSSKQDEILPNKISSIEDPQVDDGKPSKQASVKKEEGLFENISLDIKSLVEQGILQKTHEVPFQKHLGLIDGLMDSREMSFSMEACERVRVELSKSLSQAVRKRREWKAENRPSEEQLAEVRRLLGNRPDRVRALSREELVRSHKFLLGRISSEDAIDPEELQEKVAQYEAFLDEALYSVFQWLVEPQYSPVNSQKPTIN